MISERQFARGFGGFWSELLPLQTPSFMRLFNEAYIEPVFDENGVELNPVPISEDNENPSIVAEMAFRLAKKAYESNSRVLNAAQNDELVQSAERAALSLVDSYEGVAVVDELCDAEREEAIEIARAYDSLISGYPANTDIIFSPRLCGAGFLNTCEADLVLGDTLYEVKTVNRNYSGKDLRQLIVYLALNYAQSSDPWTEAGFFNPRRSTVATFNVDTILYKLSGGRPSAETYHEIISFISSRETEFDVAF